MYKRHDDEQAYQELGQNLSTAVEEERQFLQDKVAFEEKERAG
jgi:hypothetical protein